MHRSTLALGALFALFLAAIAYLLTSALARREAPTFTPSPVAPQPPASALVIDTISVDARNERRWAYVDFDRRSVVMPPDTAGWDLAVRRFHVLGSDAIADLGEAAFDSVLDLAGVAFAGNSPRNDSVNPAIQRWYRYNMLTHLLEPNGHVYAVRTREGTYAKVEILSYYCEGLEAGCLTFRYRHPVSPVSKSTSPQ